MKISKIIFTIAIASTFLVSSCRDTKTEATDDHGHEHDADGGHMDEEDVEQEEFEVGRPNSREGHLWFSQRQRSLLCGFAKNTRSIPIVH